MVILEAPSVLPEQVHASRDVGRRGLEVVDGVPNACGGVVMA